jgi:uncharacterized protein YqcC (DUF446 family)
MAKVYYLPASRAVITGLLLIILGLAPIFGVALLDHSLLAGLQFFAESFLGFPQILLGIICLLFLLSGILYLKNYRTILRLKLDDNGIYYMPFGEGIPSGYKALFNLFFLKEKLKFIPYEAIEDAAYVVNKWLGDFISLNLKDSSSKRLLTAPYSQKDKKELCSLINTKLHTDKKASDVTGSVCKNKDIYQKSKEHISRIEKELKSLEDWQPLPPDPGVFTDMGAFGSNSMPFTTWLQFVFIPNVKEMIDKRGSFPKSSGVATYAYRNLEESKYERLKALLSDFDALFN